MVESYGHPNRTHASSPDQPKLILAVDDENMITELYRRCFPSDKYRVITVNDSLLAIEALKIETPDLIMMDLNMPGLHGIELYKTFKERPDTAKVPVIVISGFLNDEACRMMADQDYVVDKGDFDISRLTELVTHILENEPAAP